jgi:hypothetical protein
MNAIQNRQQLAKPAEHHSAVSGPGRSRVRASSAMGKLVRTPRRARSSSARGLALLVTTFGFFGGTVVAQARAQTETLSGTTTTISGSVYGCPLTSRVYTYVSVGAHFTAAGSATADSPYYPATFTNPSANATVAGYYGKPGYMRATFTIPFVITSGMTTITGTIRNPYGGAGMFECGTVIGGANAATYTATIQPSGQTISGTARVFLDIPVLPGAPGTITEALSLP